MYCGLPVIASSTGGQTDFLEDGATGFLVPVGDSDALADRLLRLAEDRSLRERISSYNKEYAKRFHISGVAERYETLFSEVIRREGQSNLSTDLPPLELREEGTHESPHDAQ
jgi:glycosyltransferase involved in cell wall biosynthesis